MKFYVTELAKTRNVCIVMGLNLFRGKPTNFLCVVQTHSTVCSERVAFLFQRTLSNTHSVNLGMRDIAGRRYYY